MTVPIPYRWKRLSPKRRERLDRCIVAYFRRLYRQENPSGSFRGCGRNGLPPWYPFESQPCCGFSTDNSIIPTRANPLALNTHCRSIEHLANLYDADLNFLHRQLRLIRMSRVPPLIDAEQLAQQASDYIEYYRHELEAVQRHELAEAQRIIEYISTTDDFVVYSIGGGGPREMMPYYDKEGILREGYIREEGYISADQLIQQADDYAERICDANSRERYTLDYIEGYISCVENDRIRLRNIKHWFDYQLESNYQEESRRHTPPTPELDEPVRPGKLPFAPQIDVKDDDIDDFLSELG